jgi:phospholipid/cholesterol/gamma-HCH transport system substrate-binding protein
MPQQDSSPDVPRSRTGLRIAVCAVLTLVAVAVFAIIARMTFLRHEADITTLIDDSAGIAPSSPVTINGIDVGHVVKVELSGSPDPNKTVRITMRFPRHDLNSIPRDSTAAITSGNLLGDKYIDISCGKDSKPVEPGAEIPSTLTQDIGTVLSHANIPLKQVNAIIARIDKIVGYVDSREGTLGKFLNDPSFAQHVAVAHAERVQLFKDVNSGRGVLGRMHELSAESQKPMARLSSMQADLNAGKGSLGELLHDTPSLTDQARSAMDEANQLIADFNKGNRTTDLLARTRTVQDKLDATMERINSGQGTIGQFVVNPQLRDSVQRVTRQLERLTDEVGEHPTHYMAIRFGLF